MKKNLIIFSIVSIVGISFYLFKSDSFSLKNEELLKFLNRDQITSNDTVVHITEAGFEPEKVVIKKGNRVVWINEKESYSWPASDPHPTHENYSGFDPEEPFRNGEAWAYRFELGGNWQYHDHLKPSSLGIVEVRE